jgi:hypothetical protein
MGIFFDHGVEYIVRLAKPTGGRITLLDTSRTDARLLRSSYYAVRKDRWFNPTAYLPFERKITDAEFDVVLSDQEASRLACVLAEHEHEHDITDHGWFEVNRMSTTYDLAGPRLGRVHDRPDLPDIWERNRTLGCPPLLLTFAHTQKAPLW